MVTFDSLGLILSISSSILPGFQHTMAFSQDWGETVKKNNHPSLQFILHIQPNYNYNRIFHLTASPTTLKINNHETGNLTSVFSSQPHQQQHVTAHRWQPAPLTALPGNRTARSPPSPTSEEVNQTCSNTLS